MDSYNQLMELGYTQNEIDEMDILYHLQLLGRRKQEKEGNDPVANDGKVYIDDLGL